MKGGKALLSPLLSLSVHCTDLVLSTQLPVHCRYRTVPGFTLSCHQNWGLDNGQGLRLAIRCSSSATHPWRAGAYRFHGRN